MFRLVLSIIIILTSCNSKGKSAFTNTRIDTTFYNNGHVVKFYSSDNLDSTFRFEYINDTVILTARFIENNSYYLDGIRSSRIGDSIEITLINPSYEYMDVLRIIDNKGTLLNKVKSHNSPHNNVKISIRDTLENNLYIRNWSIYPIVDSIGGLGIEVGVYIKLRE